MIELTGYQLLNKLYESNYSLVYHGFRGSDHQTLILKFLKQEYPSPADLTRYQQEYEITRSLNSDFIIRAEGLQTYKNTLIILLEDFGGEALSQVIRQRNLSLENKLKIAIKICEGLVHIHDNQIIHKDINPTNIVINQASEQVKIIDFGLSTILARETPTLKNPNVLEGTLYYISPEQTGRMNCNLDYRTDFYSLGATLYELFTHKPPFTSQDELELIHCHLAKIPVFSEIIKSQIPPILCQIILKLMAKRAEDRYQSAYGIKADLETCLNQLHNQSVIQDFPLAQKDSSNRFQLPQKLYGRETEIKQLLSAFERVCYSSSANSEMVLISGYSGIGKSALVREIYKPITQAKGYFISGKFEQYKRHIPYSAIIQAFQELVNQLLTEKEIKLQFWKDQLQTALGNNGKVIIEVIPEVELIIGSQPSIPILSATESQNRLNLVFENFIQVFTQPEHPLVIFLDDLQWADPASLQLIKRIIRPENSQSLLLIGAYRDNEVDVTHPLSLLLEKLRQTKVTITSIILTPLSLDNVTFLIHDSLKCSIEKARPLAELVLQKTEGNPFFINEFLKSLYQKELLYLTSNYQEWTWNLSVIQQEDIADNVIELMTQKIETLEIQTQEMLKQAACLGSQFDLQMLSLVGDKSTNQLFPLLKTALNEGLIVSLGNFYQFSEREGLSSEEQAKVKYKFTHDRIQQAAYSLISPEVKPQIHRKIGELLLKIIPPQKQEKKVFDIVNQLNLAIQEIKLVSRQKQLATLNLMAGQKAKKSAAYESAYQYFKISRELLNNEGWKQDYETMLEICTEAAETAYLSGDFATMEQLINEVLDQAKTLLEKVKLYEIKIQAYNSQNQIIEAINIAIPLLEALGVKLSFNPSLLEILRHHYQTKLLLRNRKKRINDFSDLPILQDPTLEAIMRMCTGLLANTYFASPKLMAMIIFQMVNISIKHGLSLYSPLAFASYGGLLCGQFNDLEMGYQFGQLALKLLDKLEIKSLRTRTIHVVTFSTLHWKEPLKNALILLENAYQGGVESGDLEYAALGLFNYSFCSYLCGRELNVLKQELKDYQEANAKINQQFAIQRISVYQQVVSNLTEDTDSPDLLCGEYFNEVDLLQDPQKQLNFNALFHCYLNKIILNYLFYNYEQGYENCNQLSAYTQKNIASITVPVFYFYDALFIITQLPQLKGKQKKIAMKRLRKNYQRFKRFSRFSPENHLHKFYLIEAEMYRYQNQPQKASNAYDKAIELAEKHQYLNEQALANELAAKFYLQYNKPKIAQTYMTEAKYLYMKWGALTKVKQLENLYPELLSLQQEFILNSTSQSPSTTGSNRSEALDLQTVFKASQILSEEIMLDKLLEKLMRVVLENAGAQKGFLILNKENQLQIESIGQIAPLSITVRQSLPIQAYPEISLPIINYVTRTRKNVVLGENYSENLVNLEAYLQPNHPQSILCTPIIKQGSLKGLLYLENNLTGNAFTPERLKILDLLSTQIAISLENATYYQEMSNLNESLTAEIQVRQETENRLRESEERFRIIADTSPVPILITRLTDGKRVYANPACNLAVGLPPNELSQLKSTDFYVNPQDRLGYIQQVIRDGQIDNYEVLVKKIDGTPFWINSSSRLMTFNGEQTLLTAFFDLTERKKNEQFQTKYRYQLEMEVQERTKELSQTLEVLKATQAELVLENTLLRDSEAEITYDYQVGGSLPLDAPTYVVRYADRKLYKSLKLGEYCYILNPRQMGKSSLRVQMMKRLESENFACAAVDLSAIGNRQITLEQWYAGFTYTLANQFKVMNPLDFRRWWKENNFISPIQRLSEFIETILIPQIETNLIVFIDEIDSVLDLDIELDDFFILLRHFWNKRADNVNYKRLSFVFLGVATPSQLLSDKTRTPFNIGTFIELKGFQLHEAQPLIQGLSEKVSNPQAFLREILNWTNGQPFLTQKICKLLRSSSESIPLNQEAAWVSYLVQKRIIEHWESQDEPEHLKTIRDRLLSSYPYLPHLFEVYLQIYQKSAVIATNSAEERELILSGLVIKENSHLLVHNQIYHHIFTPTWVMQITK